MIGIFNNQGINVWHINPGFDNRGRHQHIILAMNKVIDDPFKLRFRHLTVRIRHSRVRHQLLNLTNCAFNVFNPIVQIKDLAATIQFSLNGLANRTGILFHDNV